MTGPEIGRTVHYVSYGSKDGRYASTCRAAIVTEVHSEVEVGLCTLNPTGVFFDRRVRQDEDPKGPGTWHWPCIPKETDG
jgi:hypothetical protein